MRFVRACPNCGSADISEQRAQFFRRDDVGLFCCNICDFESEIFPEVATSFLSEFKNSCPNTHVVETLHRSFRLRAERAVWLAGGATLTYLYGALGFVLVLFAVTLRRRL